MAILQQRSATPAGRRDAASQPDGIEDNPQSGTVTADTPVTGDATEAKLGDATDDKFYKPETGATTEDKRSDKPVTGGARMSFAGVLAGLALWIAMCSLPLVLTLGAPRYRSIFPSEWFDEEPPAPLERFWGVFLSRAGPTAGKPLGLILGLLAVAVGIAATLFYHWLRRTGVLGPQTRLQVKDRDYVFSEGVITFLASPEGFLIIGGYLSATWLLGFMPASYYSFAGGINWGHVAAQLLLQDCIQCFMHLGEHKISSWVYRNSHKPHHRFTNPRLFDAFDGSPTDTIIMICIPFLIVARLVPANVWSYMAFGSFYSCWLALIHSEYVNPWDPLFRKLGLGTAADHHVHHSTFTWNFGHLFMYWDKLLGTYKNPSALYGKQFNKNV